MPKTCCLTGCDVGKRTCTIKVSLFRLPSDPAESDRWNLAIPRAETNDFKFDSPDAWVCALHFDLTDVSIVNPELVSHRRVLQKLRAGAVPRIFPNCPPHLTTPKPRSRVRQVRRSECPYNDHWMQTTADSGYSVGATGNFKVNKNAHF